MGDRGTRMYDLTALYLWRNTVRLGFPCLESVLSTIDMVDEAVLCVDPTSDDETLKLAHALDDKFDKVRIVWFKWPIGATGDGSVIGIASSFALAQVRTTHTVNIQSDEIYPSALSEHIRDNWRSWVNNGYECLRIKVLNTEHNIQGFQGGGNWDWQNGAGYNHSYKFVKKCANTKFLHDAWSFDWQGFVAGDIAFSETFPIVHCHDMHRDNLIDLRQSAANEIWTDRERFGNYKETADDLEKTRDKWWNDPKWTSTDSPFAYLLPEWSRGMLGQTRYVPNYDLLDRW